MYKEATAFFELPIVAVMIGCCAHMKGLKKSPWEYSLHTGSLSLDYEIASVWYFHGSFCREEICKRE